MTRIYLVRHWKTIGNRDWIVNGHTDDKLSDIGIQQCNDLKIKLQGKVFDTIFSSDLDRAIDTAKIITWSISEWSIEKSHLLRERFTGKYEWLSQDLLRSDFQNSWLNFDDYLLTCDWCESSSDMIKRYITWYNNAITWMWFENILIVSHGAFIRTIIGRYLWISQEQYRSLFGEVKNCWINCIETERLWKWKLLQFNW